MIYIPEDIPNRIAYVGALNYVTSEWTNDRNKTQTFEYLKDKNIRSIVDIGCNFGVFTERAMALAPERIDSFEPDEINFSIMQANLEGNTAVHLHHCGIFYGLETGQVRGTGDGNTAGYIFEGVSLDHLKAHRDNLHYYDGKVFEMRTLESSIDHIPDLIKIDAEGSEYNIIENSSLLKEARYLIIESHGYNKEYISTYLGIHLANFKKIIFTSDHLNDEQFVYSFLEKL